MAERIFSKYEAKAPSYPGETRIGFCAAGKNGFRMSEFAANFPHPLEFIATCYRDPSAYEPMIADLCQQKDIQCYRKINANDAEFVEHIKEHDLDLLVLAWYPDIIKKPVIDAVNVGVINHHPSLLPYNRGKYPYYWTLNDGTPFGLTIHFIDENMDSGDVLFQKEIKTSITDTGETLFKRGYEGMFEFFKECYPKMVRQEFNPIPQDESKATSHLARECREHSHIDLDKQYTARDLINRIRGRTFIDAAGADGSYFFQDGKKYIIRTIIEEAKEAKK